MLAFINMLIEVLKKVAAAVEKDDVSTPPVDVDPQGPELPTIADPMSLKLGVIIGHEKLKPGAIVAAPINSNEYTVNSEIAIQIQLEAKKRGLECIILKRDGVGISGTYSKAHKQGCDAVIELHFNAFNKQAFGTETLCTKYQDDLAFAKIVHKHIAKCFQRLPGKGDRGVKALSLAARGGFSVYQYPSGVNCLVEPFFGDNPDEVKLYLAKKDLYPVAIVDAVIEWGKSVSLLK